MTIWMPNTWRTLNNPNSKRKEKDDDENGYILVREKDWEEAKASRHSTEGESHDKEDKKEDCFMSRTKTFLIFLLIISLPMSGLVYFSYQMFKEEPASIEYDYCNDKGGDYAPVHRLPGIDKELRVPKESILP